MSRSLPSIVYDPSLARHRKTSMLSAMETSSQDDPFARLERQNAALSALAKHPDLFTSGPLAFSRRVTEAATSTLGVARASIWFFTENLRAIHCEDLFEFGAGRHTDG